MERQSQVLKEKPNERTAQRLTEVFARYEDAGMEPPSVKRGPSRKLSLEQEFHDSYEVKAWITRR